MDKLLWKNNAESTAVGAGGVVGGILSLGGTSLNLDAGGGTLFPSPGAGECFLLTIYEKNGSAIEENHEVVKVTGRSADNLTIVRNQEGATYGFPTVGGRTVYVAQRLTALGMEQHIQTGAIENGTDKATPVDADLLPLVDSAATYALKKLTWANVKATLKAYYDAVSSTLTNKGISLTTNTVTGTKAEFDAAVSDGNICFDGDAATNLTMSTARILGRSTASTGAVEEITVGTGLSLTGGDLSSTVTTSAGKHTVWIPAGAMTARTTNGAASGTAETTTNKVMLKTLDFDTATQEYAQFSIQMPKSWNESTVTFIPVWSHAATTTNFGVVWTLAGVALANDDAADTAFGTVQSSTDTGGTTNDIYVGPESSAITIANTPGAQEWVVFQLSRLVSDGGDTMAIDARLHGIQLIYTTDATTDA